MDGDGGWNVLGGEKLAIRGRGQLFETRGYLIINHAEFDRLYLPPRM